MREGTGDGREWAARLGQRQRAREEATAHIARAEREAADQALVETRARWPLLVEAIRCLIAAYNSGAGHPILTVAQDESSDQASVTVESSKDGHPFLSARLDGALICVSARDGQGVTYDLENRMVSDRNDERTAAYLLQNWMERL